jgi:hypothetical protein
MKATCCTSTNLDDLCQCLYSSEERAELSDILYIASRMWLCVGDADLGHAIYEACVTEYRQLGHSVLTFAQFTLIPMPGQLPTVHVVHAGPNT